MGLGKTLSMISVITTSLDRAINHVKSGDLASDGLQKSRATLVIAPSVGMLPLTFNVSEYAKLFSHLRRLACRCPTVGPFNIRNDYSTKFETCRHLQPNTLKSCQYHGGKRETDLEKLADHDVVLTTFATVTTERYRSSLSPLQRISWFRIILDEGK